MNFAGFDAFGRRRRLRLSHYRIGQAQNDQTGHQVNPVRNPRHHLLHLPASRTVFRVLRISKFIAGLPIQEALQ
jgi:hypothetical protein